MVMHANVSLDEWDDLEIESLLLEDLEDEGISIVSCVKRGLYLFEQDPLDNGNFRYGVLHRQGNLYTMIAYVEWKPLANGFITPYFTNVKPCARGLRIPELLYRYALSGGYRIQAGDEFNFQTYGGAAIWWRMNETPEVKVYAVEQSGETVSRPFKAICGDNYPYLEGRSREIYGTPDVYLRMKENPL